MNKKATVCVIDDDADARDSLKWLLESVGLYVETFANPADFLTVAAEIKAECLIIDVKMPNMSGIELHRRLRDVTSQTPAIFVSGHAQVSDVVAAWKQGAVDFLEKPFSDSDLLEKVQAALALQKAREDAQIQHASLLRKIQELTERERETLLLIGRGLSTKQIAKTLAISTRTVDVHRSRITQKLEASGVADLVRIGLLLSSQEAQPNVEA